MTKFVDSLGLKKLVTKIKEAVSNGTWLPVKKGESEGSVVMGSNTSAYGEYSHAEGGHTTVSGKYSHAQGFSNYDDHHFIDMIGVGNEIEEKNAFAIYAGRRKDTGEVNSFDSKNGYLYLLGVGDYEGKDIHMARSVQEVIWELEKGVAETETMTVEEIREIMSA